MQSPAVHLQGPQTERRGTPPVWAQAPGPEGSPAVHPRGPTAQPQLEATAWPRFPKRPLSYNLEIALGAHFSRGSIHRLGSSSSPFLKLKYAGELETALETRWEAAELESVSVKYATSPETDPLFYFWILCLIFTPFSSQRIAGLLKLAGGKQA